MSREAALLAILGRVRRRLRTLAALEGAVLGGAVALAMAAGWWVVSRWRGAGGGGGDLRLAALAPLALGLLGAALAAARRIPLERCARILDRTLDGQDRVLSALSFCDAGAPRTPFTAAAIADAAARCGAVAPAAAAPLRRPRALPALAAGALLIAAAALVPQPARGSRAPVRSPAAPPPAEARVRIEAGALEAERDEVARALQAAASEQDLELAKLARELAATVGALSGAGLSRADALDRLTDLQRRSDEAAAEAERLRRALAEAGDALHAKTATRQAGQALRDQSPGATEKALTDLAARAGADGSGDRRQQIAGALEQAAGKVGAEAHAADAAGARAGAEVSAQASADNRAAATRANGPDTAPSPADQGTRGPGQGTTLAEQPSNAAAPASPEETRRRLARDGQNANRPGDESSSGSGGGEQSRKLQRLQRELEETAAACRADPASCRRKLDQQARGLPRMEREARSAESRQRLSQAVRQLRERLRRSGAGDRAGQKRQQRAERKFMREARGPSQDGQKDGQPGAMGAQGEEGEGEGDGEPSSQSNEDSGGQPAREGSGTPGAEGDSSGDDSSPGGAGAPSHAARAAAATAGDGQSGQAAGGSPLGPGAGIGNQNGGAPLGDAVTPLAHGHEREAKLRGTAGPTRSQVIQSAAQRGFAHTAYRSVFDDYQAAVEESLDDSAVPPGRRYIVRRYFQLIRPRTSR